MAAPTVGTTPGVPIAHVSEKSLMLIHADSANGDNIKVTWQQGSNANVELYEELKPNESLLLGGFNADVFALARSGTQTYTVQQVPAAPPSPVILKFTSSGLVESATSPNQRVSIWNGAAEATMDTTGNDALGGSFALNVVSHLYALRSGGFERLRTPDVFKTVGATALGNTTVWTPAAGKKFRLMGGFIVIAGTMAAAGIQIALLQDGAGGTTIVRASGEQPAAVATGETVVIPLTNMGNGYLSSTTNNVLNVNLGTAMASGEVTISVWGAEE